MQPSAGRFCDRTLRLSRGHLRPAAHSPTALAGLALLLAACRGQEAPAPPPPAPVMIAVAAIEVVPLEIRGIGAVEASSTVSIRSRVGGQILRVHFTEGQDVERGDLLFSIDPRPSEAALRQAKANLRRDEAQAANAAGEARRYAALVAEGVASREDAEAKQAAAEALSATVQADRAAVASSQLQLEYTTIRAPMDARAGSIQAREGSLVQADVTELVVVNRIRPVFVDFTVPEQRLGEVRQQMARGALQLAAAPPDDPGPPERGAVTFIDNAVNRTTGTILLRATFSNETLRLWPGQFVRAAMTLTTVPAAIVIPPAAVQTSQAGTYAFVVQPDLTVQMRPIALLADAPEGKAVVASGLAAGERVVTEGQVRLAPGTRVVIQEGPSGGQDAGSEGGP